MARIKRHRNARSHQRTKHRSRNPNIPELIYKFLVAEDQAARDVKRVQAAKCRSCGRQRPHNEVVDSASTNKGMGYRARRDAGKVSKSRGIKRRPTSRDLPISYLQKCIDAEGTRKTRKYIKKALNFAVESGYLIPSDPTYKILRVSSDLMKSDSQKSKNSTNDKERETPNKLEDLQVQEQRRRRRGRTRSRSPPRRRRRRSRRGRRRRRRGGRRSRSRTRSRSRSRVGRSRYSSPQNPEEVAEDGEADDYEMNENDPKGSNIHTNGVDREPKTTRPKQADEEQSKKPEENDSDLSVDEDESDDEEGKKRVDTTES